MGRGAFLASQAERLRAPGQVVKMVSTADARDNFPGALAWYLYQVGGCGAAAGTGAQMTRGKELCRVEDEEQL